jgi:hypothetical protein
MNIFYLDTDPKRCAQMHNDKHTIKMILEYAQLLSTAHRVLDGTQSTRLSKTGRKQTTFVLPDDREPILYSATHINHPSAIWVRQSKSNYDYLYWLFYWLCREYTYRYGKLHATDSKMSEHLVQSPQNIGHGEFTEPTPAMPDDVKVAGNSLASYRNYYREYKQHLLSWKGRINSRPTPQWIFDPELNNA